MIKTKIFQGTIKDTYLQELKEMQQLDPDIASFMYDIDQKKWVLTYFNDESILLDTKEALVDCIYGVESFNPENE